MFEQLLDESNSNGSEHTRQAHHHHHHLCCSMISAEHTNTKTWAKPRSCRPTHTWPILCIACFGTHTRPLSRLDLPLLTCVPVHLPCAVVGDSAGIAAHVRHAARAAAAVHHTMLASSVLRCSNIIVLQPHTADAECECPLRQERHLDLCCRGRGGCIWAAKLRQVELGPRNGLAAALLLVA